MVGNCDSNLGAAGRTGKTEEIAKDSTVCDESLDFFSLAGIWQDRDVTIKSIRKKAWFRRDHDSEV
jgi:hypothetical protein